MLTVGLVSFAMGAESGGQWGTIGAGTLMVCLPLMLAFILFRNSSAELRLPDQIRSDSCC
ncbi:hypothetical protein IVZ55_27335 [Salmonella enterica subsp. enterica serovar Worthington]|nr:hypothetical protein [Salmonella enterica subsp. enterica serovar Worthington]